MEQWFLRLRDYFPAKEMKSERHIRRLLKEKQGSYLLEEGPFHTLLYFEKPDYLFVDYILVSGSSRGSGHGSRIMERLKSRNKLIILEVDPVTPEDLASGKRVRFYERLGFRKASLITYSRIHPVTGERTEMDIFYWSPRPVSQQAVLSRMRDAYLEVHTFHSHELYGIDPEPAAKVLQLQTEDPSVLVE